MLNFSKQQGWWLFPLIVVLILAPFTPRWDLSIARYFYHQNPEGLGHFRSNAFDDFMYNYAVIPAQILAIIAAILYLLSFFCSPLKKFRISALVLILTMVVGAGFITHTLLKDHWGRPRPRQVIEFGGKQSFRPFYSPNFFHQPEPSKSFPCGHCTMAFYFFAVALVLKRFGLRAWFYFTMMFAVVFGLMMGIARMAQGGHFFSDVLLSGVIMWLTAYASDKYLNESKIEEVKKTLAKN
jgi:lipid A 4'-phosphatase